MSIRDKALEKLMRNPPPCDMNIEEVETAAKSVGIIVKRITSSHYMFEHPKYHDKMLVIPRPHGGQKGVKRTYIKKLQDIITEIKEQENE